MASWREKHPRMSKFFRRRSAWPSPTTSCTAMVEYLFSLDRRLYLLLHGRLRASWLDYPMVTATRAGTKGTLWLALALGLVIAGSAHARLAAATAAAALILAETLINVVLKPLIRRERPFSQTGVAS